jgi:hypothetical protein
MNTALKICVSLVMRNKLALLVLAFLAISNCYSQSGLEVSGFYARGFQDQDLKIFNEQTSDYSSYAYQAALSYTYSFNSLPLKAMAGVGFKRVYFSGQTESSPFSGEADRPLLRVGARYLFGENWEAGFWLGLEGNRDMEELRIATTDNFRSYFQLEGIYRIWKGVGVSASYYRGIHPLQDHYTIYNPSNLVALGLNISFFE